MNIFDRIAAAFSSSAVSPPVDIALGVFSVLTGLIIFICYRYGQWGIIACLVVVWLAIEVYLRGMRC